MKRDLRGLFTHQIKDALTAAPGEVEALKVRVLDLMRAFSAANVEATKRFTTDLAQINARILANVEAQGALAIEGARRLRGPFIEVKQGDLARRSEAARDEGAALDRERVRMLEAFAAADAQCGASAIADARALDAQIVEACDWCARLQAFMNQPPRLREQHDDRVAART